MGQEKRTARVSSTTTSYGSSLFFFTHRGSIAGSLPVARRTSAPTDSRCPPTTARSPPALASCAATRACETMRKKTRRTTTKIQDVRPWVRHEAQQDPPRKKKKALQTHGHWRLFLPCKPGRSLAASAAQSQQVLPRTTWSDSAGALKERPS